MPNHRFICDGRSRALQGASKTLADLKPRVQQRIEAEFSERLLRAGWIERLRLRIVMAWRIRQEFNREVEKLAPRGGLYFCNSR